MLNESPSEFGIIDVQREADDVARIVLMQPGFQFAKKCGVRLRIMKRLARSIQHGDAPFRDEDAKRR